MKKAIRVDLYLESKITRGYLAPKDIKCYNSPVKRSGGRITTSTTYNLSDEDKKIKGIIEELVNEANLEYKLHDLANKEEKKKAKSIGIKSTPLILIDNRKISPVPSDEDSLLKLLNHHLPNDFPKKRGSQSRSSKSTIEIQKLDGKTIIDMPKFFCSECGSNKFKILQDYSGFCAECGKAYMEIK